MTIEQEKKNPSLTKQEIQNRFYEIYRSDISIEEFEAWLYTADDIEEVYGTEFHFKLLDINYKAKYSRYELIEIIFTEIPFGRREQERIKGLLDRIVLVDEYFISCMEQLYEEYCEGYGFLEPMDFIYIVEVVDFLNDTNQTRWFEKIIKNKRTTLADIQSRSANEARRILDLMEIGTIRITEEYEYIDNRKRGHEGSFRNETFLEKIKKLICLIK